MHKRRFLFVTGCLMAALVLFWSTETLAQDVSFGFVKDKETVAEGATVNITVNVDTAQSGGLDVTMAVGGGGGVVFYGPEVTGSTETTLTVAARENQSRITITAASVADGNGMNEAVTLMIPDGDLTGAGKGMITITVVDGQRAAVQFKDDEATVLEGAKTSVSLTAAGIERGHNMAATVHVEEMSMDGVRRVQLLKTGASYDGDGRLILTFKENMDVSDELEFDVQGLPDADGMNAETMLMLTMPGDGVKLGSMTEMMVMVIDDDEDTGDPEEPEDPEEQEEPEEPAMEIGPPTEVMVKASDMMLMVSWNKPDMGASMVTGYMVQYRQAGGSWSEMDAGMMREATIDGLVNGVEYSVRVMAYGEDDMMGEYSEEMMATPMADDDDDTPVPALPIFGAVALGAGLLAAGRARLRRRELRAGRVQRQINR